MEVANNILRDVNEEKNVYFVDLDTGIKAEVFYLSDCEISLIRGKIEKEDIERASSLGFDLKTLKGITISDKKIIEVMKSITMQIKSGVLGDKHPRIKCIRFQVGEYKYFTMCKQNLLLSENKRSS